MAIPPARLAASILIQACCPPGQINPACGWPWLWPGSVRTHLQASGMAMAPLSAQYSSLCMLATDSSLQLYRKSVCRTATTPLTAHFSPAVTFNALQAR